MATDTNDTRDPKDRHDAMASKLYEGEKRPLADKAGQMYSWTPAGAAFDGAENDLFVRAGMNPAAIKAERDTFAAIQRETGLPDVYVGNLATAAINTTLARARVSDDPDADELAFQKRKDADWLESRERLATIYSKSEAHDLINRATRFVKSNAKLAKVFKDFDLGSRPDIVMPLVEFIRSSGWGRQTSR